MDLDDINDFSLKSLAKINVILGKNGCGKSHLLKRIEAGLTSRAGFGRVRYISPERGGMLRYEPGIEQNIAADPKWMTNERRRNQSSNFREQSAALFRRFEMRVLRGIEEDHTKPGYVPRKFAATLDKLNRLLDRVELKRNDNKAFAILLRGKAEEARPEDISSGESELISLGIEFLAFANECEPDKQNVLLVDEPDVHLHPDLQHRLAEFIADAVKNAEMTLVLATHSTALLAALSEGEDTRVAFMRRNDRQLTFKSVSQVDKTILPIFGAHPLSNVFNQSPVLLIEGEDDERMWQQAVRSAGGRIRVYPCPVNGLPRFAEYESEVNNVIEAVYDSARAYSLRDRDMQPEHIADVGHLVRMRLSCRAAENLMLSDDALAMAQTDWPAMQMRIREWAAANKTHQYHSHVQSFIDNGLDRMNHDLKEIRNILVGLMSSKPWEVLVGQAIAELARARGPTRPGTLREFVGEKVAEHVLRLPPEPAPSISAFESSER